MNRDFTPGREPISRQRYLQIVHAALTAGNYRFAQQAVIKWLANYPGDLQAGLYYARALLGLNRPEQALSILDGLCLADPEFDEAAKMLLQADLAAGMLEGNRRETSLLPGGRARTFPSRAARRTYIFALTGHCENETTLMAWGSQLLLARQALQGGNPAQARDLLTPVLEQGESSPLTWVTHLSLLAAESEVGLPEKRRLARSYHRLWPDCLACMLWLARWSMEDGRSDLAVALMHQAAARDVGGQVANRLWGRSHAYRGLWPERPELQLDLPVPADVAALLGWNRLTSGKLQPPSQISVQKPTIPQVDPALAQALTESHSQRSQESVKRASGGLANPAAPTRLIELPRDLQIPQREDREDPDLSAFEAQLERLAKAWNLPSVKQLDGRYPVYVVFSLRKRLEARYGAEVAASLELEMKRLVEAVGSWHRWGAILFLADDPAHTRPLGIAPSFSGDPWELKLILADLDEALGRRGERIGAVLIVGGPQVVPFHHLPNPVDDPDADVPSDNPYATRDENYFVPEWLVGRLPGGAGKDARLLLLSLRRISERHAARARHVPWHLRCWGAVRDVFGKLRVGKNGSFGYTAAAWRGTAESVFRPIGKPDSLRVSPPLGLNGNGPLESARGQATTGVPAPAGSLGYFNLHGLVDAAEWFGQRDPLNSPDGPDYPVALRPQDIASGRRLRRMGGLPQVVFSEACYGLHLQGRSLEQAIALKFLEAGSLAVAGSTCMAYGSMDAPLAAADLLGHTFWRFIRQGMPAGEALRQAKIHLVDEMHRRQGYLDGEDQKTLLSFVLYGDPLAQPAMDGRFPKSPRYRDRTQSDVETVCTRADCPILAQPVPDEVMDSVRWVVAKYLPGMSDARLAYARERRRCNGGDSSCAQCRASEGDPQGDKGTAKSKSQRAGVHCQRVTLSKQVPRAEGVHTHYARLTMDEHGDLVKLVVSR